MQRLLLTILMFFILTSTLFISHLYAGSIQLPTTGVKVGYVTGDDGNLKKGVSWPNPRFTDLNDGTVIDNMTGLNWLKNPNCFGYQSWNNAISSANNLASGACGLTDGSMSGQWRLPNVEQLESLVDLSMTLPALPTGHPFFPFMSSYNTSISGHWTSSSTGTNGAWFVNMGDGYVGGDYIKGYNFYVWPVKSGQFWFFDSLIISASINFGNLGVSVGNSKEVRISSKATTARSITATTITGVDSVEFTVAPGGSNPCSTLTPTVAVGATCTMLVTANPTYSGTKSANLSISTTIGSIEIPITATVIDPTAPTISTFNLIATSTTQTVPINLTATDNVAVTGYCLTETNNSATCSWNPTAQSSYTFTGIPQEVATPKTLYAFAKDAADNISSSASASTTITLPDTTLPTVSAFTMPTTSTTLFVPITNFTATDNLAVTGYCLAETNSSAACSWSTAKPVNYTFSSSGVKTLYAFAKDAAGNVSIPLSAPCDVATAPITSFTVPATSKSLAVAIATFTATDNIAVTGYKITESAIPPLATDTGWSATAPINYTFTSSGIKTLYAWAKDAAGNISTTASASVLVDTAKPTVSAFTIPTLYNSLTVPVASFTATDDLGLAGYLITTSATAPLATDSGWSATAPSTYTFAPSTTSGTYTLYAWAKDQADNISLSKSAPVTLGCSVTTTTDINGDITLPGQSIYNCSQNRLYRFTPKPGYKIADVLVDGVSVGAVSHYLFGSSATFSSHTIAASFAPDGNANWSAISAGNNHSAAIRSDGTLWSWGTNDVGQVGDGSLINRTNPVQVGNKTIWDRVSTGNRFTLGHRTDGSLWSWGDNSYGQLGDTTTVGKIIPQQLGLLTTWSSVVAGGLTDNYPIGASNPAFPGHSAALMIDGSLQSWGYNAYGEVGNNSTANVASPVTSGTTGIQYVDLSAGANHTAAIRSDGTLWSWGRNNWGQVGNNTLTDQNVPIQVGTATDWIAVTAGYEHTLAIRNDGSLWGWGHNDQGQLGLEMPAYSTIPILISNTAVYKAIATGGYHSLAIRNDGTLWGFGRNLEGQLGDGTGATKSYPVQVGFDSDWATVEAGEYHTVGLKANGTMWSWGGNVGGQLGDTTTSNRLSPVMIGTNTNNFLIRSSATTTGGNITPLGNVSVSAGTGKAYSIAPIVGYQISDVKVDGVSQGAVTAYTFTNVTGNHTIEAIFTSIASTTYTITALASTGGSITPPGTVSVNNNANQSFTISPLGGYIISDVTVDNVSQGAISGYTFTSITANHTISATFAVIADTTPPTISAFSIPASSTSLSVSVNLTASDNSGTISSHCLTESNNSSTCIWTVQKPTTYGFGSAGVKNLYAFVKDPAGNISASASTTTIVGVTGPTLTLSTLANGAYTNNATLNISGTVTDASGVASLTINMLPVTITNGSFSYPLALNIGANTITTAATDTFGNTTIDTRTITLDTTAPTLTITAPADNYLTGLGTVAVSGTVSKTATVLARVNSGSWQSALMSGTSYSILLNIASGQNTIELTATDTAGNSVVTTAKRTITYDATAPTLAVTNPNMDISTASSSLTLTGTVSDTQSSVTVNISHDGQNFTPTVTSGSFSQLLNFTTPKTYPVVVNAVDAVGNNSASITRNIIYAPYAVNFIAGTGGSISGSASQTINEGGTTTLVTAVPGSGYGFINWTGTGGFITTSTNPLVISNVTAPSTITANFSALPITGNCGTANGTTITTAPTSNLCSTGTASTVIGSGPWNWSCPGSNGGAAASCSANLLLKSGIVNPAPGKTRPDLSDALRTLSITMGTITPTATDYNQLDIAPLDSNGRPHGDGVINTFDVIGILRMVVGLL